MAVGVINLRVTTDLDPNSAQDVLEDNAADAESYAGNLRRFVGALGVGHPFKVTHWVDSETAGSNNNPGDAVSITNTVVNATLVTGVQKLTIGDVTLSWVTTESTENEVTIGASDTASGTNLAAAINDHSVLGGILTASSALGVVTIALAAGARVGKVIPVTVNTPVVLTNTITQASLVSETDTLVIGGVSLLWDSAPSGENEVLLDSTDTLCGDALAAAIIAHSVLGVHFHATNAAGVVSIYYTGPSEPDIIGVQEAGSGQVLSAASFIGTVILGQTLSDTDLGGDGTLAEGTSAVTYSQGVA